MNQKTILLVALLLLLQACHQQDLKLTKLDSLNLDGLPSGSGIVVYQDNYYAIGDDSPFLFQLNNDFEIIRKIPFLDPIPDTERIPKSIKPDFEALELIGENEMIVFGSGSKSPERDVFTRILLNDSVAIEKYDISSFYKNLKNLPSFKGSELNIEAAAYHGNHIFLFNRKKNLVIRFNYEELLTYIKGERTFPQPVIKQFVLPKIKGIEAGFSGATTLKRKPKIIFTASVENTDNAYDDGEILGSFLGMIDISNTAISASYAFCEIPNTEVNLKVESVSVVEEIEPGRTKVVLITDDDKGNSILLHSELLW